jgi:hypothetical protein
LPASSAAAGRRRPVTRAARPDDLDAIVSLELTAFANVYKTSLDRDIDPDTVAAVRQRFADRMDFLGPWVRVLENPAGDVVGAKISFPIKLGLDEIIELCDEGRDMRDIATIRDVFDEGGTALWGLSLAVAADAGMLGGMPLLNADMRAITAARGIWHTYFLSRLPGLADWAARQLPDTDVTLLPRGRQEALAAQYLQATVRHGGTERTADPLLAMYVAAGVVPVRLVSCWGATRPTQGVIDMPSLGFHVLCQGGARGAARP